MGNTFQRLMRIGALGRGAQAVDPQDTPLVFTCTTTGAQTLTLQGLTVAAGKSVVVDWGDTNTNTYTAGAGTRTHAYAGAGTWTVKIANRRNITLIDFEDTKITSLVINSANPLPTGLTSLTLSSLAGLTYNANTNPLPTGITYLYLSSLAGLTWEIKSGAAWPTGATAAVITGCPSVTCTAWTDNSIRSIQAENAYSQANVDAFLNAIWANKANFTYAAPTLDLLGGSNAAPSGIYQYNATPTTGKEKAYALVNTAPGNNWVVQTA